MKILFLSAEVAPYVAVGGLSQVMYFLPRALIGRGHDVRVFTPKYGGMKRNARGRSPFRVETETPLLSVPVRHLDLGIPDPSPSPANDAQRATDALTYGGAAAQGMAGGAEEDIRCSVSFHRPAAADAPAYFLENEEYFGSRANVFGYLDDHIRFALLSKACLLWLLAAHERARRGEKDVWIPDIVHCNDWHASYFIDLLKRSARARGVFASTPVGLTVHNFQYQGNGDFRYVPEADQDDGCGPLAPLTSPLLKKQNALKRGLLYADAITTVSPTHAREVLTSEYAYGLEATIQKSQAKLSGILNGIDTREFNPGTDPLIPHAFTARSFVAARAENKRALQRTFGLREDPDKALLAFVGRLSSQKGLDLLTEALAHVFALREDVQFLAVGNGEDQYRSALETLRKRFPDRVGLHLLSDFRLPRAVFAGADLMLIPSLFEPGGIIALEALRYGAVPLVRRTGGLNDSVEDFDSATKQGNGFSFQEKDPWALFGSLAEALSVFHQTAAWKKLVLNDLRCDFSWDHAAAGYAAWYDELRRRL